MEELGLGPHNAVWDDGEWISWDVINSQLEEQEWCRANPRGNYEWVGIFEEVLSMAETFHHMTGRHLQIYGDIGEIFAAMTYGVELHEMYEQGSDGKLGRELVEIKTVTPFKRNARLVVNMSGDFTKLVVVRINEEFEVKGRLFGRKELPAAGGKFLWLDWTNLFETSADEAPPA